MLTDREKLQEALIEAYAMEKGAREFYGRAAGAAYEKAATDGFGELARMEAEHMDYIRYLYQAIAGQEEPMDIEGFRKAGPEAPEGAIPAAPSGEKAEEFSFDDDTGAIAEALKMEAGSFAFYDGMIKKMKGPAMKALVEGLKNLEETHIKYLKELRLKLGETP